MAKSGNLVGQEGLNRSVTHLLHRALQLALDFHAEAAKATSLTQRQFTVLSAAAGEEGLTQNDLVRATGIDRSTLADLVARMLAKGLLERERSATDARAKTVRLSSAGRDALEAGADAAREADERLLALFSPKKREAFLKSLGVLAVAADGDSQGPAPDGKSRPAKKAKVKDKGKAKKKSQNLRKKQTKKIVRELKQRLIYLIKRELKTRYLTVVGP